MSLNQILFYPIYSLYLKGILYTLPGLSKIPRDFPSKYSSVSSLIQRQINQSSTMGMTSDFRGTTVVLLVYYMDIYHYYRSLKVKSRRFNREAFTRTMLQLKITHCDNSHVQRLPCSDNLVFSDYCHKTHASPLWTTSA